MAVLWLYHGAMKLRSFSLLWCCLLLAGCKEPVRTYRVAKEPEAAPPVQGEVAREEEKLETSVTWQASSEWTEEKAGQFLTAAYAIPDLGRLTVSRLGGDGGGLAANVNRWRGQVNLAPLPEEKIVGQPMPVTGSKQSLLLFNLTSDNAPADADGIFAAVLPLASETWYFKLTAPSAKLRVKGAAVFTQFLSTVRIGGEDAAPNPPPAPTMPKIQVVAPEGWEEGTPGSMRVASFAVKGADGATADVSVIPLPGNSGSVLENVNRWRGQIQLPPLISANDPALGNELDGKAGQWIVTHMVSDSAVVDGKKVAISAAILKVDGVTWFFKMTGEAALVAAQRGAFEEFVRSATFPQ